MRPHRCQSKLWRCAQRGYHPKYAAYSTARVGGVRVWVAVSPLSGRVVLVRRCSEYTLGEFLTEVAQLAANHGRPIPRDVTL